MAKGKNLVYVGPADGANRHPANVEGVAVAAILPGTLVEHAAADAGLQVNANAATVFDGIRLVADKDQQRTKSMTDAWTINENMVAIDPRPGEFFNILVVTGQALVVGTPLTRNGAGLLKIAVTPATIGVTSEEVLFHSDETITTSGTQLVRVKAI
jgi:hypothetical protein